MACGAAYVASDYGGVHEYTEEGRNVLLSKPRDVEGLVRNVADLLNHESKRLMLAENGYRDIKILDWNKAVERFEQVI